MAESHALQPLGAFGVAVPTLSAMHDTLVDIARAKALAGLDDLARDAEQAEHHTRIAASFAVHAFNHAHPRLAIRTEDPLTPGQQKAFTKFVQRSMRPLSVAQIGQAAVKYMAEMQALAEAEEQQYLAERVADYEQIIMTTYHDFSDPPAGDSRCPACGKITCWDDDVVEDDGVDDVEDVEDDDDDDDDCLDLAYQVDDDG